MRTSFIEKLCCHQDKHELELQIFEKDENGDILEGLFTCPECKRYYPIIYGIPIMTPDEYREKALEAPILEKWGLSIEEGKEKFLIG